MFLTVTNQQFKSISITDPVGECEREDYPKDSYLHRFVGFLVERILFEQSKYMAVDIECAIDKNGYKKVILEDHKVYINLPKYSYSSLTRTYVRNIINLSLPRTDGKGYFNFAK